MLLSLLSSLASAGAAPNAQVVFEYAPHFADLDQQDKALQAYGFAPVGGRFSPQYGVRGVFEYPEGLRLGLAASSGFSSNASPGNPVPTTTTWTQIGGVVGYRAHPWVSAELELGFGSLTHSVGSQDGGGALLYLGPYAQPQISLPLSEAPWAFSLGLGWMLHFPLSQAHTQPLWEHGFERRLVSGPTLSLQSGFGSVKP